MYEIPQHFTFLKKCANASLKDGVREAKWDLNVPFETASIN